MKRAYKYILKPMLKQQLLFQHFGCARFIYNWGLDKKLIAYKINKTIQCYADDVFGERNSLGA